ncbi:MAG: pyruvate, phosphate dikinase [Candidatus Omnitrophica bacterium]|nr:pyruvate, phosphate dikinase [Candidatus Omnitrophota bacterium]
MGTQYVYFFGEGKAEGNRGMKDLLGGKGANLAEMTNLSVPVPPGFTITTQVCALYYENKNRFPGGLDEEVQAHLARLEQVMGKKFGDPRNPLLVSVRSGAPVSMPGMMDTILNLGLNDVTVKGLAQRSRNERFAYDAYRRLLQMFGDVVLKVERAHFEEALEGARKKRGVTQDTGLVVEDLKELVRTFKKIIARHAAQPFPEDPREQLRLAFHAVFGSWHNERAIKYRNIHRISHALGTAVNTQAMVFGNMGSDSGTGVAFTRNPSTGENRFYGEYLANAQGEDVVAGIRTPQPIESLKKEQPKAYAQLVSLYKKLERHYKDMQDIEFTIESGRLFILQTRSGKRTAQSAVRIAVEMEEEGLLNRQAALARVDAGQLDQLLHRMIDPGAKVKVLAKGLPASPGAAVGQIVFTADRAEELVETGQKVILVRQETSPEDIGGMAVAEGILTARGGMTSHAAVVARGMGKCCVAGCSDLVIDEKTGTMTVVVPGKDLQLKEGDPITLNGSTGEVIDGQAPLIEPKLGSHIKKLLSWADSARRLRVRANADTPHDAKLAREFGAEGIGLCRTEHMFFNEDRLPFMRQMILSDETGQRTRVLDKLMPMQRSDFKGILEVMEGLPVTIRLLDPPLHEFLPRSEEEVHSVARSMQVPRSKIESMVKRLHEVNPMLGHRGCRLGITYPEIYAMQVRAIIEAACELARAGVDARPEIMVPLVGHVNEYTRIRDMISRLTQEILEAKRVKIKFKVGTMIEVPRAALTAGEIAAAADFFSFGTNDLTQLVFGFSRDDIGQFLPFYLDAGILATDPFMSLDTIGVGQLVELAVREGRKRRPDLSVGICGEHGGDPKSVEFCHRAGLDYVSCSPYRVPIARLAAAQAVGKDR